MYLEKLHLDFRCQPYSNMYKLGDRTQPTRSQRVVRFVRNLEKLHLDVKESTGKLKGINEESIGETHFEVVEKSNWESNFWPAVIKLCNILCKKNT